MRGTRMVVICAVMLWLMASTTALPNPSEIGKDEPKPTLWDLKQAILFPALSKFVHSPGTKLDRQFVPVEQQKDGTFLFTKVPDEWFTWKDPESNGRVICLDQAGFRILIHLTSVASVKEALLNHIENGQGYGSVVLIDNVFTRSGDQITRVVKCCKGKGDTEFMEYRYFPKKHGAACVELNVFDWAKQRRNLDQLLAHLRSHYGKFEGACQQVEEAASAER